MTGTRYILGSVLTMVLLASGCNSCQEGPELPAPVPKEGRLPRAPQPEVTIGTPPIPPPACAVVASPSVEEGIAPLEVHFTAEGMCTDAEGKFTWDFGDGSEPDHRPDVVHVYKTPGTYNARVTLDDPENNATDTDEAPITVTAE